MKNSARTLYVVGNGFDRWHGLPTSFWHFKQYLANHHADIGMAVRDYLTVDSEWRELEQALATLDTDLIEHNFSHLAASYSSEEWSDSGHHDYQYEVDRLARIHSASMRQALADWIRGIDVHQYVSIRYTERLAEAGIEPSVGSVGDSYDNALAETINGLYKAEVVHRRSWHSPEELELATLRWVDWFNHRRLLGSIGYVPPAEAEANYYQQRECATET